MKIFYVIETVASISDQREYLFQDKFKYPRILKIQQVHQEIHAKQLFIIIFRLFSIGDSFNFKATQETRLI